MNRWIERVLNIHSGDLKRGVPLSACLFLTISAYVVGKVARDALFLTQFSAVELPYADITSGVLVGFVVALYLQVGRRTSLLGLLYPHLDLHSVYFGLQSKSAIVYDNALEFLENVLKSHL